MHRAHAHVPCITDMRHLESIFRVLPPSVVQGLHRACSALAVVTQERNANNHQAVEALLSLAGSAQVPADTSLDIMESMWESRLDV